MSIIEKAVEKIHAMDVSGRQQASGRILSQDASRGDARSRPVPLHERINPVQERLRSLGMLVPGGLGPGFVDEYRRIKRPLLANAYGKSAALVDRGNLILVTSAVPNEGKTFSAVNLALSVAQEQDYTVLLIDGDISKRSTSHMLGLAEAPGLADVLESGSMDIDDVIWGTDIQNLFLVPAGRNHDRITELLASRKMSDLTDQLTTGEQNRVIIMDAPPLLATPQTPLLVNLVGQVVMVVASGETAVSTVKDALELVPQDKSVGLILNKVAGLLRRQPNQYYGYHGYGE